MDELKNRVQELLHEVNQNWVEEIKESQKKGEGLDVTKVMGKYSEVQLKFNKYFTEAEQRIKKTNKTNGGGLFGSFK